MSQKDAYRRELEKIALELPKEQKKSVMAYAELYIASCLSDEVTSRQVADAFVALFAEHGVPARILGEIQVVDHAFTLADFSV